jgi:phage gp45-like
MKLGIVMMLIASLSVALLSIPSKVAIAQTSPENQTTQIRGLTNETTQSPENQTNQTTQIRGLANETTQSPENQTNQTGQLRGLHTES